MADIQFARLRLGEEKKEEDDRRRNHRMKI